MLRELQPLTGPTGLVFPGLRSMARPMSENTLNAARSESDESGHGIHEYP